MKCPVCGGEQWINVYAGPVRDGAIARVHRSILECNDCSIQRLDKFYDQSNYETGAYREDLNEFEWDYEYHDIVQKHILRELPSMRGKAVVEVGAGKGSFLDMVSGVASEVIAVEPNRKYRNMSYKVYSYANEVMELADVVVSADVIEHTENPVEFMEDLRKLLNIGGRMYVVTPNREEILFKLLPAYKSFRYQTAHNWYFDRDSLWNCANKAGLEIKDLRTIHRRGISNTFGWLLEKEPVGDKKYPFLTGQIDDLWRLYLEREGLGEALLIECGRRENG